MDEDCAGKLDGLLLYVCWLCRNNIYSADAQIWKPHLKIRYILTKLSVFLVHRY